MKTVTIALFLALSWSSYSETIYESATYVNGGLTPGFGVDWQYLGTAFSLDTKARISAVGGTFWPQLNDIFGAIVPLPGPSSLPTFLSTDIEQNALGAVVFPVTSAIYADVSAPLEITLEPGDYALIFGSLKFGATGGALANVDNIDVGSPYRFYSQFGGPFIETPVSGIRVFIEGTFIEPVAIPLPTVALFTFSIITLAISRQNIS